MSDLNTDGIDTDDSVHCSCCNHPSPELEFMDCGCKIHVMCFPISTICQNSNEAKASDTIKCPSCGTLASKGIYLRPIDIEAEEVTQSTNSSDHEAERLRREEFFASIAPLFMIPSSQNSEGKISDDVSFRNGRWSQEEVELVDHAMKLFNCGSLPIRKGTTLNDFLRSLLLCKSTRLRKKIKNANFCTRTYEPRVWDVNEMSQDVTKFSDLHQKFVSSIDLPDEKRLIQFSTARSWGMLFWKFCVDIGYKLLLVEDWLNGLEEIEEKASAAKNARKRAERRKRVDSISQNGNYGIEDVSSSPKLNPTIQRAETIDNISLDGLIKPKRVKVEEAMSEPPQDISEMASICNQLADWNPFIDKISRFVSEEDLPFEYFDVWITDTEEKKSNQEDDSTNKRKSSGDVALRHVGHGTNPGLDCIFTMYHMTEFGKYSSKFMFPPGMGLPGRCYTSCMPTWDDNLQKSAYNDFPRADGAKSHGLQQALGIPLASAATGQIIVIALYSGEGITRDENLVQKCCLEFQRYNPFLRWELVLDMEPKTSSASELLCLPPSDKIEEKPVFCKSKKEEETTIVDLLGKYAPLENGSNSTALLQSFTSLRLALLKIPSHRSSDETIAIDTLLRSYSHYLQSNRIENEIATLLANDWMVLSTGFYCQPNQSAGEDNGYDLTGCLNEQLLSI